MDYHDGFASAAEFYARIVYSARYVQNDAFKFVESVLLTKGKYSVIMITTKRYKLTVTKKMKGRYHYEDLGCDRPAKGFYKRRSR